MLIWWKSVGCVEKPTKLLYYNEQQILNIPTRSHFMSGPIHLFGKKGNGRSLMVERQWLLFHVTFNDVQKINSISWEINYSDGNASRIQNFNVETKFIKFYIENTENKWTYNFIFGRNLLFLSFSRKMTVKWNIFNGSRIRCNVCCRKFSLHFTFSFLFFTFYLNKKV